MISKDDSPDQLAQPWSGQLASGALALAGPAQQTRAWRPHGEGLAARSTSPMRRVRYFLGQPAAMTWARHWSDGPQGVLARAWRKRWRMVPRGRRERWPECDGRTQRRHSEGPAGAR